VPARVLVPAPHGFYGGHIYQVPVCAVADIDGQAVSLLGRSVRKVELAGHNSSMACQRKAGGKKLSSPSCRAASTARLA
jgi:hypothetical protein